MSPAPEGPAPSFEVLAQRSEIARTRLLLGALAAMALLYTVRRFAGGIVMQSEAFWWTLDLVAAGAAFEVLLLVMLTRAESQGAILNARWWRLSAAVEVVLGIGLLAILQVLSPRGEVAALSGPTILLLPLIVVLSILRLHPGITLSMGLAGAAGHAALALRAYSVTGADPSTLPVYLSYAVLLAFIAAGSALVARRARGYVRAAVREESERRHAQVVARNTLIFALAKLAEFRDTDTGSHLERVGEYCAILARGLAPKFPFIDDDWAQTLRVASSMHDIGKVGIPDAVLCKPGRLTDDERLVIQRHPGLGHSVLADILARNGGDALLEMSDQIAACHHERWDGTGYPAKLAGEAIPLPARIAALADVYDALTSPRVYKPAMDHAVAVATIAEGGGKHFDPAVVAAFLAATETFDQARRAMMDAPVGAA